MVFCGKCGQARGFPMSSMRANRVPCEICGGFDQLQVKGRDGIKTTNLPNYSYPTDLLPTMTEEREDVDVG